MSSMHRVQHKTTGREGVGRRLLSHTVHCPKLEAGWGQPTLSQSGKCSSCALHGPPDSAASAARRRVTSSRHRSSAAASPTSSCFCRQQAGQQTSSVVEAALVPIYLQDCLLVCTPN